MAHTKAHALTDALSSAQLAHSISHFSLHPSCSRPLLVPPAPSPHLPCPPPFCRKERLLRRSVAETLVRSSTLRAKAEIRARDACNAAKAAIEAAATDRAEANAAAGAVLSDAKAAGVAGGQQGAPGGEAKGEAKGAAGTEVAAGTVSAVAALSAEDNDVASDVEAAGLEALKANAVGLFVRLKVSV